MRLDVGEERTRQWLEELKANDPKFYERNTPVVEATASGEVELGLVNHYYLYLRQGGAAGRADREQVPARPATRARSSASPARGSSKARSRPTPPSGSSSSCLADPQQRFYTEEAEEAEYPARRAGSTRRRACRRSTSLERGPDVDLASFGAELSGRSSC